MTNNAAYPLILSSLRDQKITSLEKIIVTERGQVKAELGLTHFKTL
jgi:hypothetical protein